MAKDHSLAIRRAVVATLRGADTRPDILGERIFGAKAPAQPEWPFVQVGLIVAAPFDSSTFEGTDGTFAVNVMANGDDEGLAYELTAWVSNTLDEARPDLEGDAFIVHLQWTGTTVLSEDGRYRGLVQFEIITGAEAPEA